MPASTSSPASRPSLGLGGGVTAYVPPSCSPVPLLFLLGDRGPRASHLARLRNARSAKLEGDGHYAQLILTLGIALIVQNGALIAFGSQLISIRTPLSSSAWTVPLLDGDVMLFVNKARGVAAAISVAVIVGPDGA